ncbi:hypothetical protein [Streptomyces sp. DSM 40484]|uniref:hypothetical protein n=1 Tax=Streptomyces kroppenstedtii TaxID=3051181 RepID=UPI0028D44D60|nr:hypothetical protein [Streptomyces sp. DSM 40484]
MSDDRYVPGRQGVCGVIALPHAPGSRLYPCGWRCALHSPLALQGIPEDAPGSGVPVALQPAPTNPSATQASATRRTELNL